MKGFICDQCGKMQEGNPNLGVGKKDIRFNDIHQWVNLELRLTGNLPSPDLCDRCKRDIALDILEIDAKAEGIK